MFPVAANDAVPVAVSVVIPCYRCASSIGRTMDSVRNQTLQPKEVILVDDASGDETLSLLRKLARDDSRIRLVCRSSNGGVASARNSGWDVAIGKYVAFLDSDATWHPRKLELHCAFMEQHPEIAVSGTAHRVTMDTLPMEAVPAMPGFHRLGFEGLLWRNRFITSSAIVRRDMPFRFHEGQRHMEDHRLWLMVTHAGNAMAMLDAPLAAHHKPDFGVGGLSADLAAMERAELGNYRALRDMGVIGFPMFIALGIWSLAKYVRRRAIVAMRRVLNFPNG